MHKEFRELLHTAEGQSRHVVVVFLDVRGFSSFARLAESTDTAEFLKSVYIKILDDYFPEADFFKPTGDGLLILSGYDRDSLAAAVCTAVDKSIHLVEEFSEICDDDPMVNFDVPTKLGIGLARGSATSLTAGDKVLDFSGRPLNLASRLMDLARPSGVVFDNSFGYDLLPEAIRGRFSKDTAYVKGLAEAEPLTVYCLEGHTEIPEYNKSPMNLFKRYTEVQETFSFRELKEMAPVFRHPLTNEPAKKDSIEVHVKYPVVRANKTQHPNLHHYRNVTGRHVNSGGQSFALVDYSSLVEEMSEGGVKDPWKISLMVEYSIAEGGADADGET